MCYSEHGGSHATTPAARPAGQHDQPRQDNSYSPDSRADQADRDYRADRDGPVGRRGFLRTAVGGAATAGVLAAAGAGAPQALAHGRGRGHRRGRVPLDGISIQLFTLRELLAQDLDGVLAALHEIGYRKVEHAGFVGRTAAQFRAALDRAGLRSTSGHSSIPRPFDAARWSQTLADARTVGQRYIVDPSAIGTRTKAAWQAFAEMLNQGGQLAREAGLSFGYHNHQGEFMRLTDSPLRAWDVLLDEIDPSLVHLEIDLFWAWRGTQDPVVLFGDKRRQRYLQFHVKDMNVDAGMTDPGTGLIDFGRIFDAAPSSVVEFIVEHDETGQNALTTARVGYEYLRDLRF